MGDDELRELATALAQCREEARHWYAVASGQKVLVEEKIDSVIEKYKQWIGPIVTWEND